MLIDENYFALEQQTDKLVQSIFSHRLFLDYLEQKKRLESSADAEQKIQEFVTKKAAYDKIKAYGKYALQYKETQQAAHQAHRELTLMPEVADYRMSEMDLQTMLDEISVHLAEAVSKDIKVDTGNPFFETGQNNTHKSC